MARHRRKLDLGEAISFDSVLTVLTVLLVLRMVFFVPMVNLDKAKTESARMAGVWDSTAARVLEAGRPGEASDEVEGYLVALNLGKSLVRNTFDPASGQVWLEAVLPDSSVVVVRHDRRKGSYVRLHAQSRNELPSCQFGQLKWSPLEKQWFSASDSIDYGERGVSAATLFSYRRWLREKAP